MMKTVGTYLSSAKVVMFTAFIIVMSIIIAALIFGVYQKNTNAICQSMMRLNGKTVIVTGGTAGMGLEIAVDLARRGAKVIVACPFEDEGAYAKKHIIQQSRNKNIVFKYLNLGSLESIRKFTSDILKTEDRLDILINNAGIGVPADFITKDGMHFIMQVNYFGAFLLTLLLLPLLKNSGRTSEPSRIVNTSSVTHWIGKIDFANLNTTVPWWCSTLCLVRVYGSSKLCLVLFTHELAKRMNHSNVVVNCVDPGFVGTKICESTYKLLGVLLKLMLYYLVKTPWQGAQTALHVALDREAGQVSGQFFKNCQLSRARDITYDDKIAKRLWKESVRLVKLSDCELDLCLEI